MLVKDRRAMAYVARINDIKPIENADKIEVAVVDGWQVVIAKKDNFQIGDQCVYIEIDSKVPEDNPYFEFLKDRKYKVKTIKLRGQISQGLIMPMDILPRGEYEDHQPVDELLDIKKIKEQKPILNKSNEDRLRNAHPLLAKKKWFKRMMRFAWFRRFAFKFLIPKTAPKSFPKGVFEGVSVTDEERCENMPWVLKDKRPFVVSTKIDGTSSTYIVDRRKRKEEVWVCSRNVRQLDRNSKIYHSVEGNSNVYWQAEDKYHLLDFLRAMCDRFDLQWAAIQGEIAGTSESGAKIQGDPHKFGELRFFGFNLIFEGRGRLSATEAMPLCKEFGIEWVPIIDTNFVLPDTMEEFKAQATGQCEARGASGLREGYVYRLVGVPTFSFKNVSREYLLKNDSY